MVAPQGMALGGGCEVKPAWDQNSGGRRIVSRTCRSWSWIDPRWWWLEGDADPREMSIPAEKIWILFHALRPVFETLAMAKKLAQAPKSAASSDSCAAKMVYP